MTAPQGDPTTAPGAPAGPEPTTAPPTPEPAVPNPFDGWQWDGKVESLPKPLADEIGKLRKENGAARTNAKAAAAEEARQELLASVAEALGIGTAEAPPTPEELSQHLQASQAEAASMLAENRVLRIAAKFGVDADELLDSNRVVAAINAIADDLEPGDVAAFDAKATEIVQQWAASRPQPPTAPASRTPVAALRPGALPGAGEPNLDDQIAEAQKAGNFRAVIALQNRKFQTQ